MMVKTKKRRMIIPACILILMLAVSLIGCSKESEKEGSGTGNVVESPAVGTPESSSAVWDAKLDAAIRTALMQDFSGEVTTSSTWQYRHLEYENYVTSYTTLHKEEQDDRVTVYLMRMTGCYGVGRPEGKREKWYELRGSVKGFCSITFAKKENGYEQQEFWKPADGEEKKTDLLQNFPSHLTGGGDELDEAKYENHLITDCHNQALQYVKKSEKGGKGSDKADIKKIDKKVEMIDVYTKDAAAVHILPEQAGALIEKLKRAYNKLKLVPVTNIEENSVDILQAVTLNLYLEGEKSPVQIIFDNKNVCWVNGIPQAWVMDTGVFDYQELLSFAKAQDDRAEGDPYGGPLELVDYGVDMKLLEGIMSDEKELSSDWSDALVERASKMSQINGVSYYDEFQSELPVFIRMKKMHLLAKELGIAMSAEKAKETMEAVKQSPFMSEDKVKEFCKNKGITVEQYWEYHVKKEEATMFDAEAYMKIRNLTGDELGGALEKDFEKYDIKVAGLETY